MSSMISNTNYPTISIISQSPRSASGTYQPIYQRNNSSASSNMFLTSNKSSDVELSKMKSSTSSSNKRVNNDLIEQYDYI